MILIVILILLYFIIDHTHFQQKNISGGSKERINLEHISEDQLITLDDTEDKERNKSYKIIKSWFPDGVNKNKLQIVRETIFSLSRYADCKTLNSYIIKKFPKTKKLIITDATANVGGNSIHFCDYFKFVNIVEIDKNAYDALNNNLKLYKLKNFKTYHNDYLKIQNELKQDIVFFDPPWGGLYMNKKDKIDLKLGDIPLHDIIQNFEILPIGIIIKAPNNYLYEPLQKNKNYETFVYTYYSQLFIIMVKKNE